MNPLKARDRVARRTLMKSPEVETSPDDYADVLPPQRRRRIASTADPLPAKDYSRQAWRSRMRLFNLVFFAVPLITASVYLFFIASDRYQADTIIAIRNPSSNSGNGGTVGGQSMSLGGGRSGSTSVERAIDESFAVVNFIRSREAFDELNQRLNLSERMSSSDIDWFGRLSPDASHERQYKHYLRQIDVSYDDVEGQIDLTGYGYDAQTAYQIVAELARMSERLVNQFNDRAHKDLIKLAQEQVTEASNEMKKTNLAITEFQLANSIIDPNTETVSFNSIITSLRDQAAAKRAELAVLSKTAQVTSPRAVEIRNMLDSVELQIKYEQARLTGKADALAPLIGSYRLLSIDQTLAQQKYSGAVAMLQNALIQAEKQKLYVVNIVDARVPVQPILPRRITDMAWAIGLTIFFWLIARLLIAAIRDHRV